MSGAQFADAVNNSGLQAFLSTVARMIFRTALAVASCFGHILFTTDNEEYRPPGLGMGLHLHHTSSPLTPAC